MRGYVKFYRQIIGSWVYEDPEALKIWVHILLTAAHDYVNVKSGNRVIKLFPGQTIFGKRRWAKDLNIDESKVYRTVQLMRADEMIDIFPTNKHSIITVRNWSMYQHGKNEPQSDLNYEPQNEPQEMLINQSDSGISEPLIKPQTNHKRTEDKNVKNVKNKYPDSFEEFWKAYPNKKAKEGTYKHYKKLLKELGEKTLLQIAVNYAKACEGTDKKFIKVGYNFFGDGVYEDYLDDVETLGEEKVVVTDEDEEYIRKVMGVR